MFCRLNCHVFYITSHVFWLQYNFCQWNSNSWWCQTTIFDGSSPLISPISQSCRSKSKFFPVNIPFFPVILSKSFMKTASFCHSVAVLLLHLRHLLLVQSISVSELEGDTRVQFFYLGWPPKKKNRSLNVTVPAKLRGSAKSWDNITPPGDEQGLDRSCHF